MKLMTGCYSFLFCVYKMTKIDDNKYDHKLREMLQNNEMLCDQANKIVCRAFLD